uniref:Chromatin accessibility complex protein 1 n=1 Tax=Gasterosteus aculeatus aculeatus TaxID=481459 RepID=A0AAQ4RFF1_GASAC
MKMSQNTPDKEDQSSTNKKNISLPISRVRLIMKSSPDVSSINQDALFLTTKATELFVQHLAVASFNNGPGKATNSLSYTDLANTAEEMETFHFLTGSSAILESCLIKSTNPSFFFHLKYMNIQHLSKLKCTIGPIDVNI